jgi:hypothetical protein
MSVRTLDSSKVVLVEPDSRQAPRAVLRVKPSGKRGVTAVSRNASNSLSAIRPEGEESPK